MLDENNYPDEASLKEIKEWDILKQGIDGLLDLINRYSWQEGSLL